MKKKFLSLAMAAVMTAAMSISALAAEVKVDADAISAGAYGNLSDSGVQNAERDEKYGTEGQVGVKPASKDDKDTSGYNVTLNADKAGKYTIKIAYVTGGDSNRGFSYQIDNGERTDVFAEKSDNWNAANAKVYTVENVELTAGSHTVKIACTSDFDTHKAVNIVSVSYELTEEAQGQAPAEQPTDKPAEQPTTAAPADNKPAQTGDSAAPMVFVALAAVAVAGVAVVCRKKTA